MNAKQKAALLIVADMIADEMLEIATEEVESCDETKADARSTLQSYSEDGAYELIDSLNERLEDAMMKAYNKKSRAWLKTYKGGK